MTEREILTKLLEKEHINVPERKALPEGKASKAILIDIICESLRRSGSYPENFRGECVINGCLIVQTNPNRFDVILNREVSLEHYKIVLREHYKTAIEAATAYLRLSFQDNIDGVPLV